VKQQRQVMIKELTVTLIIGLINLVQPTGFCYDQKCFSESRNSYFDCDQQDYHCLGDECLDGSGFDSDTMWCGFDEECDHSTYSGKAICRQDTDVDEESFLEMYYVYVVVAVGSGLMVMIIAGVCCCYCLGTCCCVSGSRGGRVLSQPDQGGYQMQVPPVSPQPQQYSGEAFLYQSNYNQSQPGGYQPQPGEYQPGEYQPNGYQPQPGEYQPNGYQPQPEGYSSQTNPPGYSPQEPGGYPQPPPPYQDSRNDSGFN